MRRCAGVVVGVGGVSSAAIAAARSARNAHRSSAKVMVEPTREIGSIVSA